jgi:outer membrane protein TolC
LIIVWGSAHGQGERLPEVTIGVVLDGPHARQGELADQFRQEVSALLSADFRVQFPEEKWIRADWTVAGINAALDRLLADREVDLVVALDIVSSHLAVRRTDLQKPLVAPFIFDAEVQGTPREGAGTGVRNLHYLAMPVNRDPEVFHEIFPFTRAAVLVDDTLAEAFSGFADRARSSVADLGIEPQIIPVGTSADDALSAIGSEVEAVYVLPLRRISDDGFARLVQGLIERRLPSFSFIGEPEVQAGILAGRMPADSIARLFRRTALNIQTILLGGEASTIPVTHSAKERLTINMATARAVGAYPSWKIITEALLVNDDVRQAERQLTLASAVEEAIEVNLDLAARDRAVAAGQEDVSLANSVLLPQVDVAAIGTMIDDDRAGSSIVSPAERTLFGSANLTQLIYGEKAWANRSIQKSLQEARVLDRETLRLDISFNAAATYLNILRAKTFERIQRDNLDLTRANLELAEVRVAVGTATPGEVYRWETQIANDRQSVIDASSQRNLTEIELNRLLHRPLEEGFLTSEADLDDPRSLADQQRLFPYLDNPWSFKTFRRFMTRVALDSSPELQALDALTTARQRSLKSAKSAFYLPDVALEAGVDHIIDTGGRGSDDPTVTIPGLELPDDTDWSVNLILSYPLFLGGSRYADKRQASEELDQVELERQATAERIEQRMRSTLHEMGASLANIDLARAAATAAQNNYELVEEAYGRGAVSILDLLDAQNVALVANEAAANAVYDFLIDFTRVQRAAGQFDFFMSAEERESFFREMEAFFQEEGRQPARQR